MECANAAKEGGVPEKAAPAAADEGGAEEGERVRREAEEDLGEQVVAVNRRHVRSGQLWRGDHAVRRAAGFGVVGSFLLWMGSHPSSGRKCC
jgi:hypothetical protein